MVSNGRCVTPDFGRNRTSMLRVSINLKSQLPKKFPRGSWNNGPSHTLEKLPRECLHVGEDETEIHRFLKSFFNSTGSKSTKGSTGPHAQPRS